MTMRSVSATTRGRKCHDVRGRQPVLFAPSATVHESPVENLVQVILLGIIEGITEFLPISSTGHLLIAEHWLGRRSDLFNVAIQAGAILAVVVIYWQRLWQLTLNVTQPANRDYLLKLST